MKELMNGGGHRVHSAWRHATLCAITSPQRLGCYGRRGGAGL